MNREKRKVAKLCVGRRVGGNFKKVFHVISPDYNCQKREDEAKSVS